MGVVVGFGVQLPDYGVDQSGNYQIVTDNSLPTGFLLSGNFTGSFTVVVLSGFDINLGWIITLSFVGAVAIFIILITSCVCYFVQNKKRKADQQYLPVVEGSNEDIN